MLTKKRFISMALFATLLFSLYLIFGCGGAKSSYDDPSEEFYSAENTLISVNELKQWVDNGCVTENGKPVLVVDFGPSDYDNDTKKDFIPCSVQYTWSNFLDIRSDGPVGNQAMVASASKMQSNLCELGITKDTVVVFTADLTTNKPYVMTRPWWTFYYWGFPESQIKILNGGSRAWYNDGYLMTNIQKLISPSSFQLADLPYADKRVARIDESRVPIGKMIEYAKNGGALILATVDGAYSVSKTDPTDSYFGFFKGFIKGAKNVMGMDFLNADDTFKSAEEILDDFAAKGVDLRNTDKNTRIVIYCYKGVLASYYYYVVKEVLGFENVALYDGSWTEWSGLFFDKGNWIGTVNPDSKYNAFDLTDNATLSVNANSDNVSAYIADRGVNSNYDGLGNEINYEDKAFIINSINGGLGSEALTPVSSGGC